MVTARSTGSGTSIAMMLRYGAGGVLDDTFGTNGVVTCESDEGNAGFREVVIQGDGKIVTSGYTRAPAGFLFLTARYGSDGTPDTTFGTNGMVIYNGGHGNAGARGIAIQGDGRIVVSGGNFNGTDLDAVVLRYNSNEYWTAVSAPTAWSPMTVVKETTTVEGWPFYREARLLFLRVPLMELIRMS